MGTITLARLLLLAGGLMLACCEERGEGPYMAKSAEATEKPTSTAAAAERPTAVATFAGGCFWCMEHSFEHVDGVLDVVSGYTGVKGADPTYDEVSSGTTGHYEAIQVRYDPAKITYRQLLDVFWQQINPTDQGGQFADRGTQYRTAIFYHDE